MILRRNSHDRYSTVAREWVGETVVLIGGGPSLTVEQVSVVHEAHKAGLVRCIAVNDAYLWAPWADILYAADASWHNDHAKGVAKFALKLSAAEVAKRFSEFAGQKCSIQSQVGNIYDDKTHVLLNANKDSNGHGIHGFGLSFDPSCIVTGSNSGAQALNIASLSGAKRILLLGFDGQVSKEGRTHWHGGHVAPTPEAAYALYRKSFSMAENDLKKAGVEVINCSIGSAIDTFPKMDIKEALGLVTV